MKCILIFGAVLNLLGVLNGSVLQAKTDWIPGLTSNLQYSPYGLLYGTSGLFYGTSRVFYQPSGLPYETSGFSDESSGLSYGFLGLSQGTSTPIYETFGINRGPTYEAPCNSRLTNEDLKDFRVRLFQWTVELYKKAAALNGGHFIISINTIWLSLAALAEGADGPIQQELFSFLNLPGERCLRQVFYQLCRSRENLSYDVFLVRNRFFITDSSVQVNRNWEIFARAQTNLNTISIPYKNSPFGEIEALKQTFNVQLPNLNLNGNSFLLETLDYRGLWISLFSNAVIEAGPFYNNFGEQVGTVEYMKIKQRVKITHIPIFNIKMMELSVGRDERYKMLFAIILGNQAFSRSVNRLDANELFQYLGNAKESPAPIDIVIPKLTMTSEIDVRKLLEELEIKTLWTDPSATRNISDPAALPSSFIQRVSVIIDDSGFQPPVPKYPFEHNDHTGYSLNRASEILSTPSPRTYLPPEYNVDTKYSPHEVSELPDTETPRYFVANRPFLFGLFDSETYTNIFSGSFSKPENYK